MILDYSPGSRFAFANGINHSHWTARDREAFTASRDDPGEVFMEATGEGEIDA
jgi:hypothetical protein